MRFLDSDFNILFLQPARQFEDLGVNLERLRHVARYGVISPRSLPRRLRNTGLVVNCVDTSVAARRILELAASRGVPRLYLFDGIYDVANAYRNAAHRRANQMDPLLYTHVACVDRWSCEAYAALGVRTHAWLPARAAPAPTGDETSPRSRTAGFLIATARTPAFDKGERLRLEKLITLTVAALERMGADYRFRIGDRELLKSLGIPTRDNDTAESFAKSILRYQCLITTPSTIATTAMLAGTPTATLDYRDAPLTQQTGWRIHQSTDLDGALASMLRPAADRMTFQAREIAHLSAPAPVEDFILDAAGFGSRSRQPVAEASRAGSVSLDYPLRWAYVNWFKRFRKRL